MPSPLPTYEFDPGGVNPNNLILNENHSVSAAAGKNLSYIVPRAAPFFRSSVQLVRVNGVTETPLTEGIDYIFVFRYNEASIQASQAIYGGIAFLNRNFSGAVRLKQYRTLGGTWVIDDHTALEQLTDTLYSVRTVFWDQLVQYSVTFPPYNHDHTYDDATGFAQLIDKLEEIRLDIVAGQGSSTLDQLADHITAEFAHTKAQVGLGNVNNYGTATPQQTIDGVRSDLHVTPLGVASALAQSGGVTGNRTIALTGDVAGSSTFPLANAWPSIAMTLADAYKGIDTRAYPTAPARGPDPNVETAPVFITNHTNSPAGASGTLTDNTTRPQFFIINTRLKTSGGDSNMYARAQMAIEHRASRTEGAQRVFVRYRELNSPYAWAGWILISGQDLFTNYGRAVTVSPDAVRLPVTKLTLAAESNGLPAGTYQLCSHFDVMAGGVIDANTPRIQIAYQLNVNNKALMFARYGSSETTWGRWMNISGQASILGTGSINALFDEGSYDQDATGGTDLTTIGYPVNTAGRLVLIRKGGGDGAVAVTNGVVQNYHLFDSLEVYTRRYGASSWGAWIKTRMADGTVPAAMLKTVPTALGGSGEQPLGDVRTALGLGSIAEYNIIISPTEPVDPPPKTLWFGSGA